MAGNGKPVGVVTHYYSNLNVGIIKLAKELKLGAVVRFEGQTTNFEQKVKEMQLDHQVIEAGKKGQEVGIKLVDKVRDGDKAYLVE